MDARRLAKAIADKPSDPEPKESEFSVEESEDETGEELEVAAGNVLSAMQSGDPAEFASTLKDFVRMCKY